MLTAVEKDAIVKDNAQSEGDTGSPEVQVALLTANINNYKATLAITKKITTHAVV